MGSALTAAQEAQLCLTCATDPRRAPGRYCASKACRCGHEECPAFESYAPLVPAEVLLDNVVDLEQRRPAPRTRLRTTSDRQRTAE